MYGIAASEIWAVPEPSSWLAGALLLLPLGGGLLRKWRKKLFATEKHRALKCWPEVASIFSCELRASGLLSTRASSTSRAERERWILLGTEGSSMGMGGGFGAADPAGGASGGAAQLE